VPKGGVGVETNIIIHTKTKAQQASYQRKGKIKLKNAAQCSSCEYHKDGYCNKYIEWCDVARIECPSCKEKRSDYDANMRYVSKKTKNSKSFKIYTKKKKRKAS